MPDKPWKQFERTIARIFKGKRYPANQGGKVDVENEDWVVQCKNVKSLSLAELSRLVQEITAAGAQRGKLGMVVVKYRAGAGKETPTLCVMSADVCQQLVVKDRSGSV